MLPYFSQSERLAPLPPLLDSISLEIEAFHRYLSGNG